MRRFAAVFSMLLLPVLPGAAWAHAVKVFAAVEGEAIVGEVYFAGGAAAAGAEVVALDPKGAVLAATQTDAEGRFRLPVRRRVDHRILADTGAGHAGSFTIAAEALPDITAGTSEAGEADAGLERQITALRRDIARLEQRIWWRDIIGGLGYILGVFGLAAFLLGRRRVRETR